MIGGVEVSSLVLGRPQLNLPFPSPRLTPPPQRHTHSLASGQYDLLKYKTIYSVEILQHGLIIFSCDKI